MKGTKARFLFLVPCVIWLALPGCRDVAEARMDPEWLNLEAERVKLAHQVELMKLRLAKVGNRDQELSALSAGLDREVERLALLEEQAGVVSDQLEELTVLVERDRAGILQVLRSEAVGRTFESFSGISGRTFEKVVITRVTDVGVEFRHATGSARLAAAELSSAQQGMLGIDPGMAGDALKEEQAVAQAYEDWVDERVAIAKADQREAEAARLATEAARPRPQAMAAPVAAANTRLRDGRRGVGLDRGTIWYPTYYSRSRYYYNRPYCTPYIPSPCDVRAYPNVRQASTNWGNTTLPSRCPSSPVINRPTNTPRSVFSFSNP